MRAVRTVAAVVFVAAIAVTGCAANSAVQPSPAPSPPVVEPAPLPVTDGLAPAPAPAPAPKPPVVRAPVLADGQYDAYITRVDSRQRRLVVDVVQVFHDARAVKEAVADGKSPGEAKYLTTWVRNENPRLRILPLASDAHLKLQGGCESPTSHALSMLAADARAMSGSVRTFYFTLTVADGAVQRVQERVAINAC
jgi:hypothetical protein